MPMPSSWQARTRGRRRRRQAAKIAKITGAKVEEVPQLLKGYVFPTLDEQASDKFLGGGTVKAIAATSAFLKEQGKIDAVLPDYSQICVGEICDRGAGLELTRVSLPQRAASSSLTPRVACPGAARAAGQASSSRAHIMPHARRSTMSPSTMTASRGRPSATRCLSMSPSGDFVVLAGRSGCGKTSLLNVAAGLVDAGVAASPRIDGRPITGPGADRAVVFQNDALFPVADGARKRRLCAAAARRAASRADAPRRRAAGAGQARRRRRQAHLGTVRRHAPARRPRPGARRRTGIPADRRTARRARRADARAHADDAARHLGAQPGRRADGHARHRGGAGAGHAHRRAGAGTRAASCGHSRPASAGAMPQASRSAPSRPTRPLPRRAAS